jgi:hypothetical protein
MKSILYVNGCSHSCGAEISYVGSSREPKDLDLSWAGQLANRFNLLHYNDAIPGNTNTGIVSTTIDSLLRLLDNHDPAEIMVIIGWSSFERIDFIYDNIRYKFVPGVQTLSYFKEWPKVVRRAFDSWIVSSDPYNDVMNKFSLDYYNMVNFLKNHNLDYYFFNAISSVRVPSNNLLHELHDNRPNLKLFDFIKNDVNYLDPCNQDMTYYHYLKARYDGHIDNRNHHFLQDAQQAWCTILTERIKGKFNI